VEKAQNPDIPFKLSHMGNTLYTPAMMNIVKQPASNYIDLIPMHKIPPPPSTADHHRGGERGGGGGRRVGDPFEKMFAEEKSRPVTSFDLVKVCDIL